MKTLILMAMLAAHLQLNDAFMTVAEFRDSDLIRCYDTNMQDNRRTTNQKNINGQSLPLPSSIETFVSLVEKYESLNPNHQPKELVLKLLKSFRIDDLHPEIDIDEVQLRDGRTSQLNRIKRLIFSIPANIQYDFKEDDFTDDEKCALHFMLSHTVNDSRSDDKDELMEDDTNRVKQPREYGVVSLNSNRMHAFALGRVLLGILAGFQPATNENLVSIVKRDNKDGKGLGETKVNLVYAVTIGDLVTRLALKDNAPMLGNGEWTDVSCPTEYRLGENNNGFVTYSELRGAADGLIIGKKIQENRQEFSNFRLSQILRQYYGSGLVDISKTKWCDRETIFGSMPDFEAEMRDFHKLYTFISEDGTGGNKAEQKINQAISDIKTNIFKDIDKLSECSVSDLSPDRKFVSPRNIFAILDYSSSGSSDVRFNFQTEVIGNLSNGFDLRPHGNLMGVFSNLKALQQNTLDIIVKNSGIAGCPSCFAKYYSRSANKEDDAKLIRDLNDTLTRFDQEQEQLEESYQSEFKAGSPGKIVLYFNFGSPSKEYGIREALWNLRRYFRGVTILAIGENNKEGLEQFVENEQTDIFTSSSKAIYDIKQRVNKVPGEYTYRACNQSTSARETDNKQVAFVPPNKIQYWAMYPQYFLKSYHITMKFRPQEGAGIRVCFTRWYGSLVEGRNENCKDSTGGDIEFYVKDPCYKRDVFTCEPFYFSVEGKKQPNSYCQSLRCSTPQDIQFEFEHQGISCNIASYVSVSSLALLLAALMFYVQKQ